VARQRVGASRRQASRNRTPATGNSHLTRAGAASIELAKRLLVVEEGERLPTVAQYARQLGTGVGTVQRALGLLEDGGAVDLEPRGRLGTYLGRIDRPKLWEASQRGLMIGLMPLPYTRRYEGLATGLRTELEGLGIPFSIAFMSGAAVRLKALSSGHDFAIVSKLAARRGIDERRPLKESIDFGPGTFVEGHCLVWASKRRPRSPKIGIAMESLDQLELARREFGEAADYVDVPYLQVVDRLRAKEFDVTVWARDGLRDAADLTITGFSSPDARAVEPLNTTAVLVTPTSDPVAGAFIESEIDANAVRSIQREVLEGKRVPRY
jgi:YhfZ C-terminal domain/Helix-turn-helix domain